MMGILDFFTEEALPQPSSTIFARFPTEINVNIINCLLRMEPLDVRPLESLLLAYPLLSGLILLITDHPEDPKLLLQVPHVTTVSIHDYDHYPWELSRRFPIKIMSLVHTDNATVNGNLTYFSSCLYSRYLSPDTTVLCGVYHLQSIGYQMITRMCKRAGVSQFQAIESLMSFSDGRRSMQLHHDIKNRQRSPPMFLSFIGTKSFAHRLTSFWRNKWPYEVETAQLLDIEVGDDPKIMDWYYSDTTARLMTLQLRYTNRLRKGNIDQPVRTNLNHSALKWVKHLYVEFDTHIVPNMRLPISLYWNDAGVRDFTLVNVNWNPLQPSGSGIENEEVLMPYDENIRYFFTFTQMFHSVTYVGIPDKVVEGTKWLLVKEFNWWRMSPTDGVERTEDIFYDGKTHHVCEVLRKLKIVSTTKHHPVTMSFTVNSLEQLTLVSLDNGVWDLNLLLPMYWSIMFLKTVYLVLKGDYDLPSSLEWKNMSRVADTVENLTIVGYNPEFLSSSQGQFPHLQSLTLDICPYLRCTKVSGWCDSTPSVKVLVIDERFPALSTIRLIALKKDRTRVESSNIPIELDIPDTCYTIEFSSEISVHPLFINGFALNNRSSMVIPGVFSTWKKETPEFWAFAGVFPMPLAFYEFDL